MKNFKAEQCVAKLARSRACDRLQPLQQSVSSSGFQRGIMTPAETLKWNPPSREAGEGLTPWSHLRIGYIAGFYGKNFARVLRGKILL